MEQLILHLVGDYLLQSHWTATQKTSKTIACLSHVILYTLPFLLITSSVPALLVIGGTHFVIDRWRLAKYLVYAKQFIATKSETVELIQDVHNSYAPEGYEDVKPMYKWENCKETGYPSETPSWLSFWLLIIADNTLHLICNFLALTFL